MFKIVQIKLIILKSTFFFNRVNEKEEAKGTVKVLRFVEPLRHVIALIALIFLFPRNPLGLLKNTDGPQRVAKANQITHNV